LPLKLSSGTSRNQTWEAGLNQDIELFLTHIVITKDDVSM